MAKVNGQTKYIVFGALMVLFVIIGSLLFASAIENDDDGDTFGEVFMGTVGVALLFYGVGVAIAVIATYLAKSD